MATAELLRKSELVRSAAGWSSAAGRAYVAGISPGASPVAIGMPARLQSEYEPG
jgi:hypothetical protein